MASEKLNYAEILADLESKRTALEAAIASIRTALTLGALGQLGDVDFGGVGAVGGGNGGSAPLELPKGALLGKSLPAAIKLYLSAVKQKQTTREIVTALKEGGVETTSDNFENIVLGALNRLRAAGDVLRFKDGWALAEFYPESLRNRLTQNEKRGRSSPKQGKIKATKKPATQAKKARAKSDGPSTDERILAFLRTGATDISGLTQTLGVPSNVIGLALGRLKHQGKIEKKGEGSYVIRTQPSLVAV